MVVVDLRTADLEWRELTPAGADAPARMAVLHHDPVRGDRTVLVDFPDDWRRDAVGRQPSQEEMVALSGAMWLSGRRSAPGQLLVCAPWATRLETRNEPDTRVVAWFSGKAGGWVEGPADPPREVRVLDLAPGVVRPPAEGLQGSVEVREHAVGTVLETGVDLLWPASHRWAHVPAGEPLPAGEGPVVIKRWV
ncbi:hypothetical protein DDE18_21355 [Nocardioides gansuensis]|uniref:Uncharacterized protein n=1 Tax=Nocardioides gansuensis TaxID=2138300 RepID=A0A2T8F514_9ACTN|nr:hypothetical protein [Nocardioides gansuensis]PVG80801.1 hypothetical protein DDE18_21355 [Nocardioides gansuensis]